MTPPDNVRARERRVVIGGAIVTALAFLLTYGVKPFVRDWQSRESAIAMERARVAYFETLLARTASLEADAAASERTLSAQARRVLHARSATLAASATQTYLQDMADASSLVVTRLEVSANDTVGDDAGNAPGPAAGAGAGAGVGASHVPVTMSAYGDIAGAAAYLNFLGSGPRVVSLDRLTLQRNAALLGAPDVVQLLITLRVPVLPE